MQTTYVRQASEANQGHTRTDTASASAASRRADALSAAPRPRAGSFKSRGNGNGSGDRGLIEALVNSKVFQDYERAFTEATGLPVALRPVETWQLPHHGKRNEGPFCSVVAEKSRSCA